MADELDFDVLLEAAVVRFRAAEAALRVAAAERDAAEEQLRGVWLGSFGARTYLVRRFCAHRDEILADMDSGGVSGLTGGP